MRVVAVSAALGALFVGMRSEPGLAVTVVAEPVTLSGKKIGRLRAVGIVTD